MSSSSDQPGSREIRVGAPLGQCVLCTAVSPQNSEFSRSMPCFTTTTSYATNILRRLCALCSRTHRLLRSRCLWCSIKRLKHEQAMTRVYQSGLWMRDTLTTLQRHCEDGISLYMLDVILSSGVNTPELQRRSTVPTAIQSAMFRI